jgi:hypothetical protein
MNRFRVWLCIALLSVCFPVLAAQGPTVPDVELAISKGRLDEAQRMMDKVLAEHPNSAKAHFVEAQLLARKGDLAKSASELKAAEQLAPGLPFAKPDAVQALRQKLEAAPPVAPAEIQAPAPDTPPADEGGWPWGWILLAIIVVGLIAKLGRKSPPATKSTLQPGSADSATPDAAQAGVAPAAQQATADGGGMAGKIVGGLVTGAAIGAGIAAAEAIAHSFRDSESTSSSDNSDLGLSSSSGWDSSDNDSSSSSNDGW